MWILKLLDVLKLHELGLENKQNHRIKNFVTGKVFPTSQRIVVCEKNGDKSYDKMRKKRLQPDSTIGVFASVKRLQLNCF